MSTLSRTFHANLTLMIIDCLYVFFMFPFSLLPLRLAMSRNFLPTRYFFL